MSPIRHWRREQEPDWCPGCGNHRVLEAMVEAFGKLRVEPWKVVVVSGGGQAGKMPHYLRCNFLQGLRGQVLAYALGVKLANPELTVIAVGGDDDIYGAGGGHLVHAFRRNLNVACLVHNNGVYGPRREQSLPGSGVGSASRMDPTGTGTPKFNPLAVGLAAGGTFLARGFAGRTKHLAWLIGEAVKHRGFGFIDLLQPCVTHNKVNTFEWYSERVYDLDSEGHDPRRREQAFVRALEWPEQEDGRIGIGVFYQARRKCHEESLPALKQGSLTARRVDAGLLQKTVRSSGE